MLRLLRAAALAAALAFAAVAGGMTYLPTKTVSVGTTATALAVNTRHAFVFLCNADASKTLYWSFDSAVTTATGTPLGAGQPCLPFSRLGQGQLLYGVTTSGTLDARVTEGFEQ